MDFQWSIMLDALPSLLKGAWLTVIIAVVGLFGGIVLGFALGICRAHGRVSNVLAQCYIELIRGTPLVVQAIFLYFALPTVTQFRIDALYAAILAIAVNSSAYIAEVVRSAILSVNKGIAEAGIAMGLPFYKVILHVTGPIALRRLIAPLGNQCVASLKDTSLFIVIGVGELTRAGQEIVADTFRSFEIWTEVAMFYLIMTGVLTIALRIVEKRMRLL